MLSLLIIYLYIQDQGLTIDYLTGAYNRLHLDNYLNYKIRVSTENKTFSAIIMDLNNFKQINDTYGHVAGDEALKETVKILKGCVNQNDFIARFGGDEFFILLDNDDYKELEYTVKRIKNAVKDYNDNTTLPYKLSFCMGYDVYNINLKADADQFLKHIDFLMYKNKTTYKEGEF